jgi:hypothetical protein
MDPTTRSVLAGLFVLLLIIFGGIAFTQTPPVSDNRNGTPPVSPLTTTTTTTLPAPVGSVPTPSFPPSPATTPDTVHARIDKVDPSQLALGKISYAYVTITNTGTVPITKIRIEITAGRDFGFPLGYQSRFMIHELYDHIEPNDTRILKDEFNLPLYEGIIPLEGLYEISMRVYANDYYDIGEWQGEVYLKG